MKSIIIKSPIRNKIGYIDYPAGKLAGMRFNFSEKIEIWIDSNVTGNIEIINYDSFDSYLELEFEKEEDYLLFVFTYGDIIIK